MASPHKKILVVEDEDRLNDLYVQLLEAEGYAVDSAKTGNEAFEKIHEGGYDLVLLDIVLPEIDGIHILQKLKKEPAKKKNVAIVLLTNLTENETIAKALKEGVSGYLIKSRYTPDQFLDEVKKHLN